MKLERYHSIVDEMESVIKSHPGGRADEEALQKIRSLVSQIKYDVDSDPYINDKAGNVKLLADILYSARKHQK
jgi:hypothetical protein